MLPIKIDSLSKTYRGKRGARVDALRELTLTVLPGEVVGFLGPNGAGKSTTIKALMGQLRPSVGSAELFGIPVSDPSARKRVGYLPENPSFYDFLSARELLELVGHAFGMATGAIRQRSEEVLQLLDLVAAAKRPIRGYSKGMVQRLGLAQALLHDPDLYILDEPMSGLDPLGRSLVKQIMFDLKAQGKTIFFSTHVTSDVEAVCDRVAVLVGGKLCSQSAVRDILQAGIEGYVAHVEVVEETHVKGYEVLAERGGVHVIFVPSPRLDSFISMMAQCKGKVHLLEPRRTNLESFFLDIVNREGK